MNKIFLLAALGCLLLSCTDAANPFLGKEYQNTYLFITKGNEYGKGGASRTLVVLFENEKLTLKDVYQESMPDETGEYHTIKDTMEVFSAPYRIEGEKILVENEILPEFLIKADTLVATLIKLPTGVPELKNVPFELVQAMGSPE